MQVYTTTQLAELLHSKPSTLRSYKQRYGDRFTEGESFVRDEQGSLLWTIQGATILAELLNTPEAHRWLQSLTPPTPAPPGNPATLETLDTLAEAVAWQVIQQQFHHRLGASLQQILYHPTPAQQEYLDRLLLNLGLSMGWATLVQTLQTPLQQTWATVAAEQRAIAVLNYGDASAEGVSAGGAAPGPMSLPHRGPGLDLFPTPPPGDSPNLPDWEHDRHSTLGRDPDHDTSDLSQESDE